MTIPAADTGSVTQQDTTLEERIAELVETVRINQQRIARLESRISSVKEELRALLAQRGENWSDDEGYARLVSEGVRYYYDKQALDHLILTDPLRYGWLKDYRRESLVQGGVQVR
ncbi:MAG: hypothetical protein GX573_11275 [Chloroflexi bacterium]|nr:hypothetical protein [Chloroflexota bacterium]